MKIDEMGAMTGMPVGRKKTRRGPRKSKSAGVSKNPHDHLKNLQGALEADDHHGARKHAFHLIGALRKAPPASAMMGDEPEVVGNAAEEALEPTMPAMPSPAKSSRLAMAAMAMRKKK